MSKVPSSLKLKEIWCLRHNFSEADGFYCNEEYFSTFELATTRQKELFRYNKSDVIKINMYYDEYTKEYYKCSLQPIYVDMPTKAEVLNKLTTKEKIILGIK